MNRRMFLGATVALALLVACDNGTDVDGGPGDSGAVEATRAICQMRVDSPSGCTDECIMAASEAPCGPEVDALTSTTEWPDFQTCIGECPTARTCTDSTGGTTNLLDCACASECIADRSTGFAGLYADLANCVDTSIAAACY